MSTFNEIVGEGWPAGISCESIEGLIAAVTNIATEIANQPVSPILPGMEFPYAGTIELDPDVDGWILCDGREVSRVTYADLFAVIGTQYGVGDGSTTFNVPDRTLTTLVGRDNMGGVSANVLVDANADVMGGTGGEFWYVLTLNQLPAHNHNAIRGFTGAGAVGNAAGAFVLTAMPTEGLNHLHKNDQPWIALDVYIKT